jgi:hypothetical protein
MKERTTMPGEIATIEIGKIEQPIDKPFVLIWAEELPASSISSTNVFRDTCAAILSVAPDQIPLKETIGTTGTPVGGETGDTSFPY